MPPSTALAQDIRYPIGKCKSLSTITPEDRRYALVTIAEMPEALREALRNLDPDQLNTPYRDGGWTVKQVVHHLADSHMAAFHRIRRALTEDMPMVPGYDEAAFARLPDLAAPAEWSLELIESLHARWVMMMQGLTGEQWKRAYNHAERGPTTIEAAIMTYSWHSLHHVAHITQLRARQGW